MANCNSTSFDVAAIRAICNEIQSLVWVACQEVRATKVRPAERALFFAIGRRLSDLDEVISSHPDVNVVNAAHEPSAFLQEMMRGVATSTSQEHDLCALEGLFIKTLNDLRAQFALPRHNVGSIEGDPESIWIPSSEHTGPKDSENFKQAEHAVVEIRSAFETLKNGRVPVEKSGELYQSISSYADTLEWSMREFDEENRPRTDLDDYPEQFNTVRGAACLIQAICGVRDAVESNVTSLQQKISEIAGLLERAEHACRAIASSRYVRQVAGVM